MSRAACIFAPLTLAVVFSAGWTPDENPKSVNQFPDGVYAVLRESNRKKEVLPLKEGEKLVVHRHRYLKRNVDTPNRFMVVHSQPDVPLDIVGKPTAIKEGKEMVGILLKLQSKQAQALERITRERIGRQLAIVIDGEVVTSHKIREVIKGGNVQITNCAAGAAEYLFKKLQTRVSK